MTRHWPCIGVVVDCTDPRRISEFWLAVPGLAEVDTQGPYRVPASPDGRVPRVLLQRGTSRGRGRTACTLTCMRRTSPPRPSGSRLWAPCGSTATLRRNSAAGGCDSLTRRTTCSASLTSAKLSARRETHAALSSRKIGLRTKESTNRRQSRRGNACDQTDRIKTPSIVTSDEQRRVSRNQSTADGA